MISVKEEDEELRRNSKMDNLENATQKIGEVRFQKDHTNIEDNSAHAHAAPSKLLFNKLVARVLETVNETDQTIEENENSDSQNFDLHKRNSSLFKTSNKSHLLKHWTYMMLEKPTGTLAFIHRLFTFSLILLTILFAAFTTIKTIKTWSENILFYIELIVTIYFFVEYCLRVWSSDCLQKYRGIKGKLNFMTRPIMIIEILAFIFGVILIIGSSHTRTFSDTENYNIYSGPMALTILRFLQLVRLLYVDRKASTWLILFDVCHKHKFELISSVYIGFITLLLSSYLIFHSEKSVPGTQFRTYSDAVYWSIITMTTIGYGDITPKTFYGKMISTGLCVLGVAFWTLPGGIIGSGFAFKIEQRNKIKKFNRLLPAAAAYIQNWWRMKVLMDIPTENIDRLINVLKAFETKVVYDESGAKLKPNKKIIEANNYYDTINSFNGDEFEEKEKFLREALHKKESDNLDFLFKRLRPQTLVIARTILLLKFFAAQNKFKSAHKPYDFKDVIEQYSKGNMDVLSKIKELQRRIEQSSNQQNRLAISPSVLTRRFSGDVSANSLETRMDAIEKKLEILINLQINSSSSHGRFNSE